VGGKTLEIQRPGERGPRDWERSFSKVGGLKEESHRYDRWIGILKKPELCRSEDIICESVRGKPESVRRKKKKKKKKTPRPSGKGADLLPWGTSELS